MTTVQEIDLAELSSLKRSSGDPRLTAECYVFAMDKLHCAMEQSGEPFHLTLLRASVAGLWQQHARGRALVGYELFSQLVRVAYISKRPPGKFHLAVSSVAGYVETGTDHISKTALRPLAFWEWPCTCAALWPVGTRFDPAAPRVVDTGNLMDYSSCPASDHEKGGVPLEKAGPEFIRVPTEDIGTFTLKKFTYWHFNRWANIR